MTSRHHPLPPKTMKHGEITIPLYPFPSPAVQCRSVRVTFRVEVEHADNGLSSQRKGGLEHLSAADDHRPGIGQQSRPKAGKHRGHLAVPNPKPTAVVHHARPKRASAGLPGKHDKRTPRQVFVPKAEECFAAHDKGFAERFPPEMGKFRRAVPRQGVVFADYPVFGLGPNQRWAGRGGGSGGRSGRAGIGVVFHDFGDDWGSEFWWFWGVLRKYSASAGVWAAAIGGEHPTQRPRFSLNSRKSTMKCAVSPR